MAGWRRALKSLDKLGGSATCSEVDFTEFSDIRRDIYVAESYGLVYCPTRHLRQGNIGARWYISQKGRDYLDGRITLVTRRPGGYLFVPTWVSALPRAMAGPEQLEFKWS